MFEFIRTHQRLMQLFLLIAIVPGFIFFGNSGDIFKSSALDSTVAEVAGKSISMQEFENAQRNKVEALRQSMGPQFDPKVLNTTEGRQYVLDELISDKVENIEIDRAKLAASDDLLASVIMSDPAFKNPQGQFDKNLYEQTLASRGYTSASYDNKLRKDILKRQLGGAIQETSIAPKSVNDRLIAYIAQEREVQAFNIKPADFTAKVKITDDMLKAFYEKNARLFEVPEAVKVEYVVLNGADLADQVSVSDAEVQAQYDKNHDSYLTKEQRRASHILIDFKKEDGDAAKNAARAKAEALLAEVRKNPDSFATIAKENSKDKGSAVQGGDLGFFGKGAMVKPFEDAASKLNKGEISDLVESDFGFHIIKLTDIKPVVLKPLSEVKDQIAMEIQSRKLPKLFAEKAATFRETVEDQSESLKPVADKLKLKIETATNLSREVNPALPVSVVTNNAKFLAAIFKDSALKKKDNTDVVDISANVIAAAHVVDYKPASKRPFDEVKSQIVTAVTEIEAEALAKKAGEEKLQALKTTDSTEGFTAAKLLSREKQDGVPPAAFAEIFKADVQKLPAFVGVSIPGNGYMLYRIGKVSQGNIDDGKKASIAQQINNAVAQNDTVNYIEALKRKAKVTINHSAIAAKSTAAVE